MSVKDAISHGVTLPSFACLINLRSHTRTSVMEGGKSWEGEKSMCIQYSNNNVFISRSIDHKNFCSLGQYSFTTETCTILEMFCHENNWPYKLLCVSKHGLNEATVWQVKCLVNLLMPNFYAESERRPIVASSLMAKKCRPNGAMAKL